MKNTVIFNIKVLTDKKEIVAAFNGLINAFKDEIEVTINEESSRNQTYDETKDKFFNDYAGKVKIEDNAEKKYNEHRLKKYGK